MNFVETLRALLDDQSGRADMPGRFSKQALIALS